jgi:hypothetical protein
MGAVALAPSSTGVVVDSKQQVAFYERYGFVSLPDQYDVETVETDFVPHTLESTDRALVAAHKVAAIIARQQ